MVVSVIFVILMVINFFTPNLWMLLTIPLGLFGLLMVLVTLMDTTQKDNEAHAKEKARLLVLKSVKLVHVKKLNLYIQDIPARLEKLTIADILDQQKRVA